MQSKKYVLISGPPGAGKDTVAGILSTRLWNGEVRSIERKFASPLKHCAQIMGFDMDEKAKDKKDALFGISPREFCIAFSETLCKPLMGERVFGNALVLREMEVQDDTRTRHVLISDSGFRPEAEALVEWAGLPNVIRLHINRPGHDFSSDSRSDWEWPEMVRVDIMNDGDKAELVRKVVEFSKEHLENV